MIDDIVISDKVKRQNLMMYEAILNNSEEKHDTASRKDNNRASKMNVILAENAIRNSNNFERYHTFINTVKSSLLTESIYKIMKEATDESVRNDNASASIMRSMISQYITENDHYKILDRMRTASVATSELYNTIMESYNHIIESVDKNDPNSFVITKDMRDDFFEQLNNTDYDEISDAIKDRVSDAMNDFITASSRDHQDVEDALEAAKEKIESNPDIDQEIKESYTYKAKRDINSIRNAPKSVLHSMIHSMCESVMHNKNMQDEFMHEGKMDMDKIVNRTKLMYTFMETLNTSRIGIVDEAFINNVINSLKN